MAPTPTKANQESSPRPAEILSQRVVERVAAILVILYVLAVVISVAARVASGVDSATPEEWVTARITDGTKYAPLAETASSETGREIPTLEDISVLFALNSRAYAVSQTANLVSAFVLVILAAVTYRVFRSQDRTLALVGTALLLGAAFFAGFSSVGGLALTQEYYHPAPFDELLMEMGSPLETYNVIEPWRALAGKVGFTFAALALLALGGLIAWSNALPRWLGWLGLVAGALMFFIWNDAVPVLHRIGGGAYLLWLLLLAGWLLFRGTHDATAGDIDAETGEH